MTDLSRLKEIALKATPGPWIVDPDDMTVVLAPCPCCGPVATCVLYGPPGSNDPDCYNTTFIALANPSTILDLIAKIEWVDVKQELPPYGDETLYLVWRDGYTSPNTDKNGPDVTTMQDQSLWHTRRSGHSFGVTHWRRITAPALPEKEEV